MSKVAVANVPDSEAITLSVARRFGLVRAMAAVRPRTRLDGQKKLMLALPGVDLETLRSDVLDAMRTQGTSGWQSRGGKSLVYGGLSLMFNPDHRDGVNWRFSSLGTPKNGVGEFSIAPTGSAALAYGSLKNSYFDSYSFRRRTPASRAGAIGKLIDSVPLSPIRSRVGIIPGGNVDLDDERDLREGGWHTDEPVFLNLRVNIPLQTDPNFVFEMEGVAPYHLPVGEAYTWDTSVRHRVTCIGPTRTLRIHLVLGFSPWFRYLPDEDAWEPNEHFGRIHPFDMIAEGMLGPHIGVYHDARSTS